MRKRRTRAEQVEANRAAVLHAAKRVFLEKGYSGATLEAIADEAGFSKGVVYSQFEGKADLFFALLEDRIDDRAAENERAVTGATAPDGIMTLLENFERDSKAEAGWARVLVEFRAVAMRDADLNRRYAERHATTVERLAQLLGDLHERAGLEPNVPPHVLAEFILALGSGMALERAANPQALEWSALARMLSRVLGPDSGGEPLVPLGTSEAVR